MISKSVVLNAVEHWSRSRPPRVEDLAADLSRFSVDYVRVRLATGADGLLDVRVELQDVGGAPIVLRVRPQGLDVDTVLENGQAQHVRRVEEAERLHIAMLDAALGDTSRLKPVDRKEAAMALRHRISQLQDMHEGTLLRGLDTTGVDRQLGVCRERLAAMRVEIMANRTVRS